MHWLTRFVLLSSLLCSGLACSGDAPIATDPDAALPDASDSGVTPGDGGADGASPDGSPTDASPPDATPGDSGPSDSGACPDGDGDGVSVCDGDCDDADPLTYPGAAEICGDGVDNGCGMDPDPSALCGGLGTFVSALTGSDATGTGVRDNPVETIAQGIANAVTIGGGTDVVVAEGTYAEAVTMVDGISVLGGFRCSAGACDWSHAPTTNESIIDATPEVSVSMDVSITRATALDGVTIEGGSGNDAVVIMGGAPTISNVVVNGLRGGISARLFRNAAGDFIHPNPTISDSTIRGGMRAGVSMRGDGEVLRCDVRGAPGISVGSDGAAITLRDNTVHSGDGAMSAISCFSSAVVTIDRNRINTDPSRVGTCTGSLFPFGTCAGIRVAGGGDFVITNNVIVGAPSDASVAIEMLDVEVPIGTVNAHSNTLHGSVGSGASGSVSAAIACASQFGVAVFGSVRNNILLGGDGATSYGFFEMDQSSGRSCNPIVFENNDTFGTDIAHRQWSTSMVETLLADISAVNALPYAQNNLSVDPALDASDHLSAGSPCVDVGVGTDAPATDIDGEARPLGAGYDIGADERP